MWKHRIALIAFFVAASAVLFPFISASPATKEASVKWTKSYIPASPSDRQEMLQAKHRFTLFVTAIQAAELTKYVQAVQAAQYNQQLISQQQESESTASTTSTSTATYGTTPNTSYSGSGSSILDCIAQAESGNNPTAWNTEGSGASGLFQFMPGTWNGYDGYANAADAPASVQWQKAEETPLSAWAGDPCVG